MKRTTLRGWFTLAVVSSVLAVGCEQAPDQPATQPVTGTVTHNGTPVEGATVSFVASAGGRGATGTTDASGKYTLTTFVAGDGAVAGEYTVKIVQFEGAAEAVGEDEEMDSDAYEAAMAGGGEEEAAPKNLLPEKYADPSTSELTASVTEGGNTFDFALED